MHKTKKRLLWLVMLAVFVLTIGGCTAGEGNAECDNQAAAETEIQTELAQEPETQAQGEPETEIQQFSDSGLTVYFLDVGQADSILISCGGEYMLVDAGNVGDGAFITSYLDDLGVSDLRYVIGTHPHADHIGALDTILDHYEVGEVMMPDKVHTTQTFDDVLDAMERNDLELNIPEVGEVYELGSASFTIIAPSNEQGDRLNDWSIGFLLVHGENRFLMYGDGEERAEKDILAMGIDIRADVYKAGHHGSRTSSSDEILDAAEPQYVVISCGKDNSYGHPHEETLLKLEQRGISVFRTDEMGTIIAYSDGSEITWNTEPDSTGIISDEMVSQEPELVETQEEDVPETAAEQSGGAVYIGNVNSKKVHRDSCSSLPEEQNRVIFSELDTAYEEGYEGCKRCNP